MQLSMKSTTFSVCIRDVSNKRTKRQTIGLNGVGESRETLKRMNYASAYFGIQFWQSVRFDVQSEWGKLSRQNSIHRRIRPATGKEDSLIGRTLHFRPWL